MLLTMHKHHVQRHVIIMLQNEVLQGHKVKCPLTVAERIGYCPVQLPALVEAPSSSQGREIYTAALLPCWRIP